MTGRRFAAVLGLGVMPQPGAALVVRQVHEDGRIELADADATDLAVAQKDLRSSRDLLRSTLAWLEELELGAPAQMLSQGERESVKALADRINTELLP